MHVILTGATGFIGAEVLSQLIAHPTVTSITALTRKPLPSSSTSSSNPKVKNIVLDDFSHYPPHLLSQLAPASACIWTIGTYGSDQPLEEARKVNLDNTIAAATAFAQTLGPTVAAPGKFTFVYTSGFLAERDPNRALWLRGDFRKMRGEVETQLLALPSKLGHEADVATVVTRPGFVKPLNGGVFGQLTAGLWPKSMAIRVDELAVSMVDLALGGGEKQVWENAELVDRGRKLLKK